MLPSKLYEDSVDPKCLNRSEARPIGPLTVQADELHSILNELRCTTRYHEEVIQSRLPALERSFAALHTELSRFLISQESLKLMNSVIGVGDKHEYLQGNKDALYFVKEEAPSSAVTILSSRQKAVAEAQKGAAHALPSSQEEMHAIRREIIGLRSLVQQLQVERDDDILGSAEKGDQLELIRKDLVELHKKAVASVSTIQVSDMQHAIKKNKNDLKNMIDDLEGKLTSEIREIAQKGQNDMKFWCEHYDCKSSQRHEKLRSQFATFVKSSDFEAYRDVCELEAKCNSKKSDQMSVLLQATIALIQTLKRDTSINLMHRIVNRWRRRQLKRGVALLKRTVVSWNHKKSLDRSRDKIASTVLRRRLRTDLEIAFRRWNNFNTSQRRLERATAKTVHFLVRKLHQSIQISREWAFKRWHLVAAARSIELTNLSDENIIETIRTRETVSFGAIRSKIRPFGNDNRGAIWMLTGELEFLRFCEIPNVAKQIREEHRNSMLHAHQSLSAAECHLREATTFLERDMTDKFESLKAELPTINEKICCHEDKINLIHDRIDRLDERHGGDLKALFDHKECSSERMYELELGLKRANGNANALIHDLHKATELVNSLSEKLKESERRLVYTQTAFQDKLHDLESRLETANAAILNNSSHCAKIDRNLEDTQDAFGSFSKEASAKFHSIGKIFDAPGIRKPLLNSLVNDCISYEKNAQEKSYVVEINSVSDGGRNTNLPISLSAFAHDFAAWIAYQADQEGILQVIVGRNPDDLIYADDKISMKRRSLLESLKTELDTALEGANPNPGALRLEARTKFVNRFVEAIDTALSKYEQVAVSSATRLGRRTSNAATCLGCDRPLPNRGRKSALLSENGDIEKPASSERDKMNAQQSKSTFVMRGGFKMPLSTLRARGSKSFEEKGTL